MSDYELLNREVALIDKTPVTQAVEIIMILSGMWEDDFNGDMTYKGLLSAILESEEVDGAAAIEFFLSLKDVDFATMYLAMLQVMFCYCVQAIREYVGNNEVPTNLAWAYLIEAERRLSSLDSYRRTQLEIKKLAFDVGKGIYTNSQWAKEIVNAVIKKQKSDMGKAKVANDPKQAEKKIVKECWDAWQKEPSQYKNNTKFANAMIDKFLPDNPDEESKHLSSVKVIADWCTE